jgi:hypothetical protein
LTAKSTLLIAGGDTKDLCCINQLYAGVEADIKGAIHAINEL